MSEPNNHLGQRGKAPLRGGFGCRKVNMACDSRATQKGLRRSKSQWAQV